ncbi:hypothetical protein ACFLXB_03390 [Chloroflexota bacterium]
MSPEDEIREGDNPEIVNMIDSQVEKVEADLVRTSRTYVNTLNAEEVDLYQSGSVNTKAEIFHANSSLLGLSQGESADINNSILLAGRAVELEAKNSAIGGIYSENTNLGENTKSGILVSGNVTGEKINSVLFVARNVEGNVETILDTRQVALASVLAGIACGAVLMLGKFLFRRR